MKKTLLLTLALGLSGASSLVAGTVDVYITGSTAFRANVYTACTKLFVGSAPTIYYANAANGGANSGFSSSTASWVMTGTPVSTLTNLSGNTLVAHGLFTGSIQGIQTTEQGIKLVWAFPHGTPGGNADTYVTNTPTIGFSDASGSASPYPATGNFVEENVCVQPFAWFKSEAASGAVTTISNITWEQIEYGIPQGRIPLSAWDYQITDTNKFIYLLQRTKDSGTRRCETQGAYYQFNDTVGSYIYDFTNKDFYTPTVATNFASGVTAAGAGVIGTEGSGNNNANLNWGYGYIGGGDIKTALNDASAADQAIAMLSMSDGKSVGTANWTNLMSYNGIWPTAAGSGIHGNSGTNDYSPICLGYYPLWGFEVIIFSTRPDLIADQDITPTQLGDEYTPGSFMGVFNAQSFNNNGVITVGSIENEIILSQPGGATGIPIADMVNTRPSVGGTIYPPLQ
jgi:hypothetical protein